MSPGNPIEVILGLYLVAGLLFAFAALLAANKVRPEGATEARGGTTLKASVNAQGGCDERTNQMVIGWNRRDVCNAGRSSAGDPLLMPDSGPEVFHSLIAAIGCTLIAFLVGGFVMGLMAERILIIEPVLATSATLLLDVLFSQTGWLKETFLFSLDLQKGDYFASLAIGAVATVAAIGGALAGERLTVPAEDWISQTLVAACLTGLFLGPFLVLGPSLPLVFTIIIGLALLGGILMAAYRFGGARQQTDEVSIRPKSNVLTKANHELGS